MALLDPFEESLSPFHMTDTGINMCVYADNGTGKTAFITTSPDCIVLSADPGGTTTAASMGRTGKYRSIRDWADMDEAYEFFRNSPNAKKYKWVWLDSASVFQDVGLEDIMTEVVSKPGRGYRKIWHPDKGEYGENMNRLKLWVRHMCALPINFGFTAHPFKDESGDEVQILPWIQGKNMPSTLCGMVDVIGYMRIQEVQGDQRQVMCFKKQDLYYAKDRFGALPAKMVDPTIPKIETLINKKLEAAAQAANARPVRRTVKKATTRRK